MKTHIKLLAFTGLITLGSLALPAQNTFPSNGNVGIGVPNAPSVLTMRGSNAAGWNSGLQLLREDGADGRITVAQYYGMLFKNNSYYGTTAFDFRNYWDQSMLSITPWGYVGIGTAYPDKKLTVRGKSIKINFSGYEEARLLFQKDSSSRSLAYGVNGGRGGDGWRWHFVDAVSREYFKVNYPTGNAMLRGKLLISNGNWSLNNTNMPHALTVNGAIRAKEIIVDTGWADDVFSEGYKLASLAETESYIQSNGHLPGIPSAKEVEANGVSIGESQSLLLRKIEELTLHMIQVEKRVAELEAENAALKTK